MNGFLLEFVVALILFALAWFICDSMKLPQLVRVITIIVFVLWLVMALLRGPFLF